MLLKKRSNACAVVVRQSASSLCLYTNSRCICTKNYYSLLRYLADAEYQPTLLLYEVHMSAGTPQKRS